MGLIKFAKIVYEMPETPEEFKEYKKQPTELEGKGFLDVYGITLEPDIPNDIMFLGRKEDIPMVINKYFPNSTVVKINKEHTTQKTLIYQKRKIIFDIDDNYKIKFKK